jgi:hypothetical protein
MLGKEELRGSAELESTRKGVFGLVPIFAMIHRKFDQRITASLP